MRASHFRSSLFVLILACLLFFVSFDARGQDTHGLPDTPPQDDTWTTTALPPVTPTQIPVLPPTATTETQPVPTSTGETIGTLPTPEAAPSATFEPSATSVPPVLPPEPPLTTIFSDNFDAGDISAWVLGEGWTFVPDAEGQALQGLATTARAYWLSAPLRNVAIEMRFQSNNQSFWIYLRDNGQDDYRVEIDPSGQVLLDHNGALIASGLTQSDAIGVWRRLRISALDDALRIAIDGLEVIAALDSLPLDAGTISFAPAAASADPLLISDFNVAIPTSEVVEPSAAPPTSPPIELQPTDKPLPPPPSAPTEPPVVRMLASPGCDYDVAAGDSAGLIAAIDAANSNLVAETICLAADATYTLTTVNNTRSMPNPPSTSISVSSGLPFITGELVIEGNNATLVRNPESTSFYFFHVAPLTALTLHDIHFANAQPASGTEGAIAMQGQVDMVSGSLNMGVGSGIHVNATGTLNLTNVLLTESSRALTNYGTAQINGGEISKNKDSAILNLGELAINGVLFQGNGTPDEGGAIRNTGVLTVTNSIFLDNSAQHRGGAIINSGTAAITSSMLRLNRVYDPMYGAGSAYFGTGTIRQSCIADNITSGTRSDVEALNASPDAAWNWWGATDGPNAGPGTGSGDTYSGDNYLPFLAEPVAGCSLRELSATGQTLHGFNVLPLDIILSATGGVAPYTFSIVGAPSNGTLGPIDGAHVIYNAATDFTGNDSFVFQATDSHGQVASAQIQLFIDVSATSNIMVDSTDQEWPFVTNGNCTLGEAIEAANTDAPVDGCPAGNPSGTDVIELPFATYELSTSVREDDSGRTGLPYISSDITIIGNYGTIRRNGPAFRLMLVESSGRLTLRELHLSDGLTSGLNTSDNGGAVRAFGPLILQHVFVENNRVSSNGTGGGISMAGSAPLEVYGSYMFGNNYTAIVASAGPVIINSTQFDGNTGGGVSGTTLTVVDSWFTNTSGRAISGIDVTVEHTYFRNNHSNDTGAAIRALTGSLILTGSIFETNDTSSESGIVHIWGSEAQLSNNRFVGNFATSPYPRGGAIHIEDYRDIYNHLTVSNAVINNNCFVGNSPDAIKDGSVGMLDARYNWWGTANGPSGISGGDGDKLNSDSADYLPFQTGPLEECGWLPVLATDQNTNVVYETATDITLDIKRGVAPYTVAIINPPDHGLLGSPATTLTYTPSQGFTGTDSFIYRVTDSLGTVDTAIVIVSVVSSLTFSDRTILTYEMPVTFTLDATGGIPPITFSLVQDYIGGTITGTSPTLTYTPPEGYPFNYSTLIMRATDAAGFTDDANITIQLLHPLVGPNVTHSVTQGTPFNFTLSASGGLTPYEWIEVGTPSLGTLTGTPPNMTYTYTADTIGADPISVTVRGADGVTAQGVVTFTTAPVLTARQRTIQIGYGHSIYFALSATGGVPPYSFELITPPAHATLAGTLPLSILYTPDAGYIGQDELTYRVTDSIGLTAEGRIVFNVNEPPALPDLNLRVGLDQPLEFDVTPLAGVPDFTYTTTEPAHGTLSGIAPILTYTPTTGFLGTDSLQVTISDRYGVEHTTTVTIEVVAPLEVPAGDVNALIATIEMANSLPGPDVIVLGGGVYTLTTSYPAWDNTLGLPALSTDMLIVGNGATIERAAGSASSFRIIGADAERVVLRDLSLANGRSRHLSPSTSDANLWSGGNLVNKGKLTLENVTIRGGQAFYGGGITNYGQLTITGGSIMGNTGVSKGGGVYNDISASLIGSGIIIANNVSEGGSAVSNWGDGATATISESCLVNDGYQVGVYYRAGTADFRGNWWGSLTPLIGANVLFDLLTEPILGCPQAFEQTLQTYFEHPIAGTLSATGNGPFNYEVLPGAKGTIAGTLPDFTYTPATGFSGADEFTFQITDVNGLRARARVRLTVAPDLIAHGAELDTPPETPINMALDATGGTPPYAFAVTENPSNGIVSGTAPDLTYTPNAAFTGTDTFTFTVTDALGDTSSATISIDVDAVQALDQTLTTPYGTGLTIVLSARAGAPPYTFSLLSQPAHGSLSGDLPTLRYVPDFAFGGEVSFTFQVTDSVGGISTGTITITVEERPPATIYVDSQSQEVPFANNGNCTLGEAIQAANTDTAVDQCAAGNGADVIVVPAGQYIAELPYSSSSIAYPAIASDITIRGAGIRQTIIEPAPNGESMNIFYSYGQLTLEGLTLRNAHTGDRGAAIVNLRQLTILYSSFENNRATFGAAIYSRQEGSSAPLPQVAIHVSRFLNNYADLSGGAIYGTHALDVTDSVFQDNQAVVSSISVYVFGSGSATGNCFLDKEDVYTHLLVYAPAPGMPTTMDATLNFWTGSASGAITEPALTRRPAICQAPSPPSLDIPAGDSDALIAALEWAALQPEATTINLAAGSTYELTHYFSLVTEDGAWAGATALPPIRTHVIIHGNGAMLRRATIQPIRILAVEGNENAILELDHITIANGRSDSGGGVRVLNGGALVISDSAFIDNHTSSLQKGSGGAINGSDISITRTLFVGNSAQTGGAIRSSGLDLTDSVFTNNAAIQGSSLYYTLGSPSNNCFINNTGISVAGASGIRNAQNNWWGAEDGPSGAGPGSGDAVDSSIIYDPFLTEAPPACPGPLTARNQTLSTSINQALSIALRATGGERPYVFTIETTPEHGTLSGDAPTLTYLPDADYMGADSFTFKVTDNAGAESMGTISITIAPATPTPTATSTATPTPTHTPIPTATPTRTPVVTEEPTPTLAPATNTPQPPTSTSVPPTMTPVPPTNTTLPPTNTLIPPPSTPVVPFDLMSGAVALPDQPGRVNATNISSATTSLSDPTACGARGTNTVWYHYRPSAATWLRVSTYGSSYDTVVGVYVGTEGALAALACSDDAAGTTASSVRVPVNAGQMVYILVANKGTTPLSGSHTLHLSYEPAYGDFIGLYNPPTGAWYLRSALSGGAPTYAQTYGYNNTQAIVCDWNGNGTDTFGIFDTASGNLYLRDRNDGGSTSYPVFAYGGGGQVICGDWDGDGKDSIGVYYQSNNTFYLRNSLNAGSPDYRVQYGFGGALPVAGDWDGDGRDSIGLYDPSTGNWYLRNTLSSGAPDYQFGFGFGGTLPVTGDWDGDARDGVGLYHVATGNWYLRNTLSSGAPEYPVFSYGGFGYPVAGTWNLPGQFGTFSEGDGALFSDGAPLPPFTGDWDAIQRSNAAPLNGPQDASMASATATPVPLLSTPGPTKPAVPPPKPNSATGTPVPTLPPFPSPTAQPAVSTPVPPVAPTVGSPSTPAPMPPPAADPPVPPVAAAVAPIAPPDSGGPTFYRAINLNGDPVVIDGNSWEGKTASNFTSNGFPACNPWSSPSPATDPGRTVMIQCYVQHWAHHMAMTNVPDGTYQVYLYVYLDWADPNQQPFNVQVEGETVATHILLETVGAWQRIGPYTALVTDGDIDITTTGGLPNLSSVEVWFVQ